MSENWNQSNQITFAGLQWMAMRKQSFSGEKRGNEMQNLRQHHLRV